MAAFALRTLPDGVRTFLSLCELWLPLNIPWMEPPGHAGELSLFVIWKEKKSQKNPGFLILIQR